MQVLWDADGGHAEITVPLGAEAMTWDEFQPHLHTLKVSLASPAGHHEKEIRFGLREVTWRGKDLLVNGRVVNLRTTRFGLDFPLTGYPATDVESWKQIIRRCREFGLNGIRFHSCCPPEAAFAAAEELGIYLQAECGLWAPFYKDGTFPRYLEEEWVENAWKLLSVCRVACIDENARFHGLVPACLLHWRCDGCAVETLCLRSLEGFCRGHRIHFNGSEGSGAQAVPAYPGLSSEE